MNEYPVNTKQASPPVANFPQSDFGEEETDLRDTIGFLLENFVAILAVALLVFVSGLAYAFLTTPIYQADSVVQVEQKEGSLKGLSDLSSALLGTSDTPTEAEIAILCSRTLVGKVVEELKLDTIAVPKRFPFIGSAMARRYKGDGPAEPIFGLASYAWGGESIRMESIEVPDELLGKPLTLFAGPDGKYSVFDPDDLPLLEGWVGKPTEGHGVRVFISELEARPGTRFILVKQHRLATVVGLQKSLNIAEKKGRGQGSGIITVTLDGADVQKIVDTVNALVDLYLRQNVERRSEEAAKMLAFLNTEVPRIRTEAQNAEAALTEYRSKTGSLGMTLEGQSFVNSSAQLEQQIAMMRLQKAELEQRFTGNHPSLIAINQKLAQLDAEKKKLTGRIKGLPETELEAIRLERDARVANDVFSLILNKTQELSVTKAGAIGNVRILDHAERPIEPVKPKKLQIAALSLVLGLFLGIGLAFTRRALSKGVEDPDEIERKVGIPVYATVPHSDNQPIVIRGKKGRRKAEPVRFVLAEMAPTDLTIESIRSLRTSLQFALMDAANNVIAITGPSIGIGKSFITVNLAATLAETGKRVLLVDADMRKGHIHEVFGLRRSSGLSNLIAGEVSIEDVTIPEVLKSMDLIPCGLVPPNPSELLMSHRFQELVQQLSARYDMVLIDTPPALAVTDACIVGRLASICFLVVGFNRHHIREIELSQKRLAQSGVRVNGAVFNDMPVGGMGYGYGKYYGYKYYRYHYQYKYK